MRFSLHLTTVGFLAVTCWYTSFCLSATANESNIVSMPFATRTDSESSTLFEEMSPSDTGIDFVQPIDITHPQKAIYVGGYASPGIAIGDLNGDGLPDLAVTGGPVKNRIYLQIADSNSKASMRFRDASNETKFGIRNDWSAGVTLVDIDNDGDLDIYVCNYDAANQLFINQTSDPAKPEFEESAKAYGLDLIDASFTAAFSDYDLDGDLDVLVSGYQYVNPAGRPGKPPVRQVGDDEYEVIAPFDKYYGIVRNEHGKQEFTNVGRQDRLLKSNLANSDGKQIRFTDVTVEAGLADRGVGNSVLWWDFNGDRLPDLFVGNDFKVADQLYRNNGDGTFTDVIQEAFPHTAWFSMGSEAGDINNDGLIDLFVSDMAGTTHYRSKVTMGEMNVHRTFMATANPRQYMRNALLLNTGTPRFMEAAYMTGLAKSDWTWAVKLADFDNDGKLDVYITNGAARMFNHSDRNFTDVQRIGKTQWDLWEDTGPRREENLAFKNMGDLKFKNVGKSWGLQKLSMSYAAAYGDLDSDGDLDIVCTHLDEPLSIYRNTTKGKSIEVTLQGKASNRYGIGATVRLRSGEQRQVRYLSPTMGFQSCNQPALHFGTVAEKIDELTVEWPSGVTQSFQDLATDRKYQVTEQGEPAEAQPGYALDPKQFWFRPSATFPALRHVENEFDDYKRQPLLPYSHSRLGGSIAVADVDGDGRDDIYHGRPSGAKRAVYRNAGGGRLVVGSILPETESEDMGALFFDADLDGDKDLYCVSGGSEFEPNDERLRDRLYLNDGKGKFSLSDGALPNTRDSGSVVVAADYDRDGDLDLFVGGRVIPGDYPSTPKSRLLKNDSTVGKPKFADATQKDAPTLLSGGLAVSAVWSDVDGDGWTDLLTANEWGPIRLFHNESADDGRKLVDRTKECGLHALLGWWNGISPCDLNRDGNMDYVVTNFGFNTQYKASDEKPELLFYGDFDQTGKRHILEAKFESDKCFPRRGLSCSSHAMPFVRQKVQTFHNFGVSTLEQIYTETKLTKSLQLSANCLASGVLIQRSAANGLPKFEFQAFPRVAQISPAFGASVHDFDADGNADIFIAQNFYSPQLETGRMDSGLSMVLRTKVADTGEVEFEPLWPQQTGIAIAGDAKSSAIVDFNQDGWADLLVSQNNGPMMAYEARPRSSKTLFRLRMVGPAGNRDCVGARVILTCSDRDQEHRQTRELTAGQGYLSQSTATVSFGLGKTTPKEVQITWPNGMKTRYAIPAGERTLAVRQPSAQ